MSQQVDTTHALVGSNGRMILAKPAECPKCHRMRCFFVASSAGVFCTDCTPGGGR